jgi:SPP1 family predicted phage head-tail adaptor
MSLRRLCAVPPAIGAYTPVGAMEHQITLMAPAARDAATGRTLPPIAAGVSPALIRALSGQEKDQAQQIAQSVSHLVAIPYLPGVSESMLVVFDNRSFQIQYIQDPDERQVELQMYCSELGQNAGGLNGSPNDWIIPMSNYHLEVADGTNAASIKHVAGTIRAWNLFNAADYPVFVKLHDTAVAPTPGVGVAYTIGIQAGQKSEVPNVYLTFLNGIAISITKQMEDSDTTPVAANDLGGDIQFT